MRIAYDEEVDALYIELKGGRAAEAIEIEEGVVADLDDQGHIMGLKVLDAKGRFGEKVLRRIEVEGLSGALEFAICSVPEEGVATPGSAKKGRRG